jgi:hypothetical protein
VKHIASFALVLLLSFFASGQTYSNANLNGKYSFQIGYPLTFHWQKTFVCPYNSSVTATAGGSITTTGVIYGVATADGNGNVTIAQTTVGLINQTSSNNTTSVTWTTACAATLNNGHIVYAAPTTQTVTGKYSVQANGTGSIIQGGSTSEVFQLAGTDSAGVSHTILFHNPPVNGKAIGLGLGERQ